MSLRFILGACTVTKIPITCLCQVMEGRCMAVICRILLCPLWHLNLHGTQLRDCTISGVVVR